MGFKKNCEQEWNKHTNSDLFSPNPKQLLEGREENRTQADIPGSASRSTPAHTDGFVMCHKGSLFQLPHYTLSHTDSAPGFNGCIKWKKSPLGDGTSWILPVPFPQRGWITAGIPGKSPNLPSLQANPGGFPYRVSHHKRFTWAEQNSTTQLSILQALSTLPVLFRQCTKKR